MLYAYKSYTNVMPLQAKPRIDINIYLYTITLLHISTFEQTRG